MSRFTKSISVVKCLDIDIQRRRRTSVFWGLGRHKLKYINPNTKYKCSKYEKDKDGNQDKRQVAFMMVGPQGERYTRRGGGNTAVLNIPPSYQLLGLPLNYNKHHIIQQEANLFFVTWFSQ